MITEEEFYRRKIFLKEKKGDLQNEYQNQLGDINRWYKSERYNYIQERKSFLVNKLKQAQELEVDSFNITGAFLYQFFNWEENQARKCFYCELEESSLEELHHQPGHINKRYPNRGSSLEIDRKDADKPYSDIGNLVLACYWCNNAKTDTFHAFEFEAIGEEIKKIWKNRLKKKNTTHNNS